jgi:hypothetical protein
MITAEIMLEMSPEWEDEGRQQLERLKKILETSNG